MATKKTKKKATRTATDPATMVREAWATTLETLVSAEQEAEKQLRALLKKNKFTAEEASAAVRDLRSRIEKERKKALKQFDTQVQSVQARVKKERKALGRVVDDAVRGTLVALNIPTRQEVAELTRKVGELSRKIDGFRKSAARRVA